jgi:DNA-binding NarL/FixJ family response regulator
VALPDQGGPPGSGGLHAEAGGWLHGLSYTGRMLQTPVFERALIVEDLDEPRQWLAELLPQALPSVQTVDCAASVAQARALMARHSYGLALVDWGLPDGYGDQLIIDLVAARPDAVVIVATIHDDDEHVFPALRAGASGYILKSQPADVVMAQLRRMEQGEPALSPSIAARVLRHFHAGMGASPAELTREAPSLPQLTDREVDVLRLIAKGYKVAEVAQLLGLSSHTVTTYVRDIYRKLGISSRAEATLEAARRGLVA